MYPLNVIDTIPTALVCLDKKQAESHTASLKKDGDKLRLEVEDRGPGIPPDKQSKVFERFERATTSKHTSGLGLGLFIVREIVQGHSGSIRLESAPGRGSKFIIEIPLKEPYTCQITTTSL